MASYAVVRDNRIVNMIEWDGAQAYAPPAGTILIPAEAARDEDAITGGTFLPDDPA